MTQAQPRTACPICGGPHVGVSDHKGVFRRRDICPGWRVAYHGPTGHRITVTDKTGIERDVAGWEICADCGACWSRAQWTREKKHAWWYEPGDVAVPWFERPMPELERQALGYMSEGFTQAEAANMVGRSARWLSTIVTKQKKRYASG